MASNSKELRGKTEFKWPVVLPAEWAKEAAPKKAAAGAAKAGAGAAARKKAKARRAGKKAARKFAGRKGKKRLPIEVAGGKKGKKRAKKLGKKRLPKKAAKAAKRRRLSAKEKHHIAAIKAWRTRRRHVMERLRQLEAEVHKTEETQREMQKLKDELSESRKRRAEFIEKEVERRRAAERTAEAEVAELRRIAESIEAEVREHVMQMPSAVAGLGYEQAVAEAPSIDEEIEQTKKMIKALEVDFYKRRISEDEFRKRLFEYQQKLRELEEKKKIIEKAKIEKRRVAVGAYAAAQPRAAGAAVAAGVGGAIITPLPPAAQRLGALGRELGGLMQGKVDMGKLSKLDARAEKVMRLYNIPLPMMREAVIGSTRGVSSERLLENFSKLIELIEVKKGITLEIMPAPVETVAPAEVMPKAKKYAPVAFGIKKESIVTDFDRVLAFVKERGSTKTGEIAKALNLQKKQVAEVLEVLEEHGLVKLQYPTVGDVIVRDVGYAKPKKAEKGKNKKTKSEK